VASARASCSVTARSSRRRSLRQSSRARSCGTGCERAIQVAAHVIDPADTRRWVIAGLSSAAPPERRTTRKRPCIDPW
jgi:hypothetical protein